MSLGNPLPGRIQAQEEAWAGTPTFRVTSTFQQHVASGRGAGIDFGNGRCGDPVLAMEAGTVTLAGPLGLANVVRIRHANGHESGYAHLATIMVGFGASVARGQQIGTVGMTGATACHLHGGYKVNGVEQDFWPLLDQNIMGGDTMPKLNLISYPDGPHNCEIPAGGTVQGWSDTALVKTQTFPGGSSFPADLKVEITQMPSQPPEGLFYHCTAGVFAGLYVPTPHAVDAGPAQAGGGFTQADLDKAKAAGKAAGAAEREALWEDWNSAAQTGKP